MVVGLPPFWYAGELAEVVLGESRTTPENGEGLQSTVDAAQTFSSVEEAVETFGFIFGRNAIRHIIEYNMASIKWRFRISILQV